MRWRMPYGAAIEGAIEYFKFDRTAFYFQGGGGTVDGSCLWSRK